MTTNNLTPSQVDEALSKYVPIQFEQGRYFRDVLGYLKPFSPTTNPLHLAMVLEYLKQQDSDSTIAIRLEVALQGNQSLDWKSYDFWTVLHWKSYDFWTVLLATHRHTEAVARVAYEVLKAETGIPVSVDVAQGGLVDA